MSWDVHELTRLCTESMAAVLHADVDEDTNFFRVGGTSTDALGWVVAVAEGSGLDLSLSDVYEAATPQSLARAVYPRASAHSLSDDSSQLAFPVNEHQRLRLAAGDASARLGRWLPNSTPNVLAAGYLLRGELDRAALRDAVREVALTHSMLRSRFCRHEGDWEIRTDAPEVTLERWTDKDGKGMLGELTRAINYCQGPLARALLCRVAQDEWLLGIAVEHLAADGQSLGIIISDLALAYSRIVSGSNPELRGEVVAGPQLARYERYQAEAIMGLASRRRYESVVGEQPWRSVVSTSHLRRSADQLLETRISLGGRAGQRPDAMWSTSLVVEALTRSLAPRPPAFYLSVSNRSFATAWTVGPIAAVVPFSIPAEGTAEDRRHCVGEEVRTAIGRSSYPFYRYAREQGASLECQDVPIGVVNVLSGLPQEKPEFGGLGVDRVEVESVDRMQPGLFVSLEPEDSGWALSLANVAEVWSETEVGEGLETVRAEWGAALSPAPARSRVGRGC